MTQDFSEKSIFKPATEKGEFVRSDAVFRNWITADGSEGPSGKGGFRAEAGRYHLYVSYACPWANRTLIFLKLKGLESAVSVDVVHPLMGARSWHFGEYPDSTPDRVNHCDYLDEVYALARPDFSGVVTVPLLWDKKEHTIVSNESSEIIRMFNSAFDHLGAAEGDYYPEELRDIIDPINRRIYHTINNGVYKAGFASTQAAYEEAVKKLFESLDWLEEHLATHRYLAGDKITEADWRLFVTLVRFDPVYFSHFKCNIRRLIDYPCLWGYTRELYQQPGIAGTVNLDHIKTHYYASHKSINPLGIVPIGPELDYSQPHDRRRLKAGKKTV